MVLNREFSPVGSQMANKHLKKSSTSLVFREIQINSIMRFHRTTVRKAKINKISDSSYWQRWRTRRKLTQSCWENKLYSHYGNWYGGTSESWEPRLQDSYTTLGHIPKRRSILTQGHFINYIYRIFIHSRQKVEKHSRHPSVGRIIKENVVYLNDSILLSC